MFNFYFLFFKSQWFHFIGIYKQVPNCLKLMSLFTLLREFRDVEFSWALYYLVTRSFFLSLAGCILLTYAHMHSVSGLLETIRLSFSSTSSRFCYVTLIFLCLWMELSYCRLKLYVFFIEVGLLLSYYFTKDLRISWWFQFLLICRDCRTRLN